MIARIPFVPALALTLATTLVVGCEDGIRPAAGAVDTSAIADAMPPTPQPTPAPEPEPIYEAAAADPSQGLMSADLAEFAQHPAPVFSGARVPPVLTPENRSFRTRINEGSTAPVDFGGNKVIVAFGCGSGCLSGYIVNVETGEVFNLGLGGEDQMYLQLNHRADSNLLTATWSSYTGSGWACFYQRYLWNGEALESTGALINAGHECA